MFFMGQQVTAFGAKRAHPQEQNALEGTTIRDVGNKSPRARVHARRGRQTSRPLTSIRSTGQAGGTIFNSLSALPACFPASISLCSPQKHHRDEYRKVDSQIGSKIKSAGATHTQNTLENDSGKHRTLAAD